MKNMNKSIVYKPVELDLLRTLQEYSDNKSGIGGFNHSFLISQQDRGAKEKDNDNVFRLSQLGHSEIPFNEETFSHQIMSPKDFNQKGGKYKFDIESIENQYQFAESNPQ